MGTPNGCDRDEKKARPLPAGPWKFWERMPERQDRYDPGWPISQVRNAQVAVKKMQLRDKPMFAIGFYVDLSDIYTDTGDINDLLEAECCAAPIKHFKP